MALKNTFLFNQGNLIDNFKNFNKLGKISYPLKTNSQTIIIETLKPLIENDDNYFAISTTSHFKFLQQNNISPQKMSCINVLTSDETIKNFYEKGIRFFTFDNLTSLENFLKYAESKDLKVSIRISINQIFNSNYHLGASLDDTLKMLNMLKERNIDFGISFYLPLKIKRNPKSLKIISNYIIKNFKNSKLKFVCMAGLLMPDSIDKCIFKDIKNNLSINDIYLEPGEYMLNNTLDLQTEIIRTIYDRHTKLVIQNGIFSGMLDKLILNKKFDFYIKNGQTIINILTKPKINYKKLYVFGGSGDSSDFLGKYYIDKKYLSLLTTSSNIYIKNVGAYFQEFYLSHGEEYKYIYKIIGEKK